MVDTSRVKWLYCGDQDRPAEKLSIGKLALHRHDGTLGLPICPFHLIFRSKISSSYRTCTSSFGNQCRFLFPPGSDHPMLPFTESTQYTYTIGEPLTSGDLALEFASPISSLDGPVVIVDGVRRVASFWS